jgi:hypothetical protein
MQKQETVEHDSYRAEGKPGSYLLPVANIGSNSYLNNAELIQDEFKDFFVKVSWQYFCIQ